MSKLKELSEFDRGSIVKCHLCDKSVREIADILQKPKSTENDVIVKWKFRSSETAEKRTAAHKQTPFQRMRSIDCNGVDLTVIGLWTCGKLFFGVMNLALHSDSRMDAPGYSGCPANLSLVTALCRLLSLVMET
ncbi:hypothetical protein TNCV_4731131 [Trichonephila clavipes]|nr:hypothetical protein TNCV_4731131 [Trichonephila clavipes]